jgi:hypothetical protein
MCMIVLEEYVQHTVDGLKNDASKNLLVVSKRRHFSLSEYQAFSPVVRIGSSRPLTHKRVCPPSSVPRGTHSLVGEGARGAN